MLFEVDVQTCISCSLCLRACPIGIIGLDAGAIPFPRPDMQGRCINCGHCAAICPVSALNLYKMPLRQMPIAEPDGITALQAEALVRNRRSIRIFETKAAGKETINQLISLASHAPTARNAQPVKWLVISSPTELKNITRLTMDWIRSLSVTDTVTYEALAGEKMLEAWEKGADPILRNAPHLLLAYGVTTLSQVDSIIALSYLELLAPVYGLGGCWAGYVMRAMNSYAPLRVVLKIGSKGQVHGAMMLGFAQANYRRWPTREAPSITWQ